MNHYKATDGSKWTIHHDYPPIPTRAYDWSATREGGEGDPYYTVYAKSFDDVLREVETWIRAEEEPNERYCAQ